MKRENVPNDSRAPSASAQEGDDGIAPGVRHIARSVIELTELQVALLRIDSRVALERIIRTIALAVAGSSLVIAAIPIALLALAEWIHTAMGWTMALSELGAAGVGIVVAIVVLLAARGSFRTSLNSFERSTQELSRNVEWLKSSLADRDR